MTLYSDNGTNPVSCTYDARGNCTVTYEIGGDTSAVVYNPFRYRDVADGCGGLMPSLTLGFGEGIHAFFGAVDDAIVYLWEE